MKREMKKYISYFLGTAIVISLFACNKSSEITKSEISKSGDENVVSKTTVKKESELEQEYKYINPNGNTVPERINPPKGYKRTKTDGYGEYLRSIKLLPDGSDVMLYNGGKKGNQDVHIAVFDIDVGKKDLQQCADAALRLRCEYLFENNKDEMINYHLTSGDEFPYEKYRDGYRLKVSGNDVSLVKKANYDRSYDTFKKYLFSLFTYAGTLSISKESKSIDDKDMQIGDIFIKGGSPGHCVIVVDMCENEDGDKKFLLAQSYMPAQQIHVLKNLLNDDGSPWYDLKDIRYPLMTPEWCFDKGSLKRML